MGHARRRLPRIRHDSAQGLVARETYVRVGHLQAVDRGGEIGDAAELGHQLGGGGLHPAPTLDVGARLRLQVGHHGQVA